MKILLLSFDNKSTLLGQIKQALNNSIPGKASTDYFSIKDTLILCLLVYSLLGEEQVDWREEEMLKVAILQRLLTQSPENMMWLNSFKVEEKNFQVVMKEKLDTFFNHLHKLAKTRSHLTELK